MDKSGDRHTGGMLTHSQLVIKSKHRPPSTIDHSERRIIGARIRATGKREANSGGRFLFIDVVWQRLSATKRSG